MKVLLIGSNPSIKSPDTSSFHPSTRSRMILDEWFKDLGADLSFINVSNIKKENNKPLTTEEIKAELPALSKQLDNFKDFKIVALGKTASKALTLLHINFCEMPHPSGLNRLLNDKNYVEKKIKELSEYLIAPLNDSTGD